MMHHRLPFIRGFALVTLLLLFTVTVSAATSDQIRTAFDHYQTVFKEYTQAIADKADNSIIERISAELQAAKTAYHRAINPNGTLPATAETAAHEALAGVNDTAPIPLNSGGIAAPVRSAEERAYDELVGKLYGKNRLASASELIAEIQAFLKTARQPYFVQEASFQLAELVFDATGKVSEAQRILAWYQKRAPTAESRRLAQTRSAMFQQTEKIRKQRQTFDQLRTEAANRWQTYCKTSWLAFPVKAARLSSYLWSNMKRAAQGKVIQSLSKEYDALVQQTYPQNTLDQFTSSNLIPCNDVLLLVNGRSSFSRRFELAAQAKSSIYLQTLLYYNDETGQKLADLLVEKAKEGVEVCVIVDDAFSQGRKTNIIRRMQNGGVKVQINNPLLRNPFMANFRSHQKMFIVDNEVAIVGGMNIANEYAWGEIEEHGWRDTDVELRGPVVDEITDLFNDNWQKLLTSIRWETGDPGSKALTEKKEKAVILPNRDRLIRGPLPVYFEEPPAFSDVRVRFLKTFPDRSDDDDILDLFSAYLATARSEAILESAYFIPHPRLKAAIAAACRRGVKVRIITNSIDSNNHPNAGWAGRACYEEALKAGAEIYEWQGAQTLHSKVTWFDGFAVTIGAYNLNSRSNSCDSEDVIAIEDRRFAAVFKKVLDRDLRRCRQITLADVERWRGTFSDRFKMDFFKQFKSVF